MSNDFYNHNSGAPGELNRGASATIRSEFDLVQSGFDKMPSLTGVFGSTGNYAVAAGSVNAWTVTVAATVLVAYTDGMQVRVKFPAANTTTTPTMNVNSLGAKSIVAEDGTALAVGNIAQNMIVALTYNASTGKLHMTDTANQSAATATTQAGIATTQAGIATTQAGIATTQAGSATTQAANALASRTAIDDRIYPGTYNPAAAPTTKPVSGNPSANGDEFLGTDGYTYARIGGVWVNQTAAAAASAAAALANKNLTDADAAATAADRAQTGVDRTAADAAATAALASGKVFQSTTAALSKGVASITQTGNGATGTNGTFALAFAGGAGAGAAGNFTVTGGAVVPASVIVTNPGSGYTSSPTVSYAASAGLAGATGVANIADNVGDGNDFLVPSSLGYESFIVYQRVGANATDTGKRILNAGADVTQPDMLVLQDPIGKVYGRIDSVGDLYLGSDILTKSIQKSVREAKAAAYMGAGIAVGYGAETATNGDAQALARTKAVEMDTAVLLAPSYMNSDVVAYGDATYEQREPTLVYISRNHMLLVRTEVYYDYSRGVGDIDGARILVHDVTLDETTKKVTISALREVANNRAFVGVNPFPRAACTHYTVGRIRSGANAGRIRLHYSTNKAAPNNNAQMLPQVRYSDDNGQTWTAETALTIASAPSPYLYSGLTKMITLKYGAHKGRILSPNYISLNGVDSSVVGVYSDDNGVTWTMGTQAATGANEFYIAEDVDGTVYGTARLDAVAGLNLARMYKSVDGGATWTVVTNALAGYGNGMSSIVQCSEPVAGAPKMLRFFLNDGANDKGTIALSYDGFATEAGRKELQTAFTKYNGVNMFNEQDWVACCEAFTPAANGRGLMLYWGNLSYMLGL